jgi:hypothetical protein
MSRGLRTIFPLLLPWLPACSTGDAGVPSGHVASYAEPESDPGADAADGGASCRCAADHRARPAAFDCEAPRLPPGGALCQRGRGVIYCAPGGQSVQTFTGDVACQPGFCISLDGDRCAVVCDCRS